MEKNSNPAKRLYEIAKKACSYKPDESSLYVWARVFEIFPENNQFTREDENKIINRINECQKLVDLVEKLLEKNSEIPHDIYFRPFPKLRELFCKPSRITWTHNQNCKLDQTDLTLIEAGIHGVGRVYQEKIVDEDELRKLLEEISELYEIIINLDIDKNLKRILVDMLKIMENAIHEYRIRGVDRLQEAVEQLFGIYFVNKEVLDKSEIEIVERVRGASGRFVGLWSFAADTVQLLEATSKYLPFLLVAAEQINHIK